jgi:putative redox protein
MVRIDVVYEGGLRCAATHAPSGSRIATDAPLDNRGRGEAFSPTDLVATALGTCMLTLMGIEAERRGIELGAATASVEKHMVADPRRRIGRLDVTIRVPARHDDEARAALERAARGCPVTASLRPEVEIPLRFEWGT